MATLLDNEIAHPIQWGDTPWSFWHLLDDDSYTESDWDEAINKSLHCLIGLPVLKRDLLPLKVMSLIQTEKQFGLGHWELSRKKKLYYKFVRPILPESLRPFFRTLFLSKQREKFILEWPIENRYVKFQFEILKNLLLIKGLKTAKFIHFWPNGHRFAFILTHDVETKKGQQFVRELISIEEQYGFRSSFNFVPEGYQVDSKLLVELKNRGFEVGVHGLKHDGKLYASKNIFNKRTIKINQYLKNWNAIGFRSPLTHRNPEWMQSLDIEYDLSFFDTDPYEMIPGGTLSIWPFQMGHFIELPYTLPQDHTLLITIRENSPCLWLKKVEFIEKYFGMVLLNAHPDYLINSNNLAVYEKFLQEMAKRRNYWHTLPRDVARWWRERNSIKIGKDEEKRFKLNDRKYDPSIWEIYNLGLKLDFIEGEKV